MNIPLDETSEDQEREHKHKAISNKDDDFWKWSFERKSKVSFCKVNWALSTLLQLLVVYFYQQFQKKQLERYCKLHGLDNQSVIPATKILLHKKKEVAFCYIPKSACTTFKILLLHTQGLIPDDYLDYDKEMQPYLAPQLRKIELSSINHGRREMVLTNYFKFVMFRHPLERLLSGYRSKMSRAMKTELPEDDRDIETTMLLSAKRDLISHAYPEQYRNWEANHESYPINISFSDFIDYWLRSKSVSNNPHFNMMVNLCKPCSVHYSYYGNFKTFEEDARLLIERIGATESELRPQYPESSDTLMDEYYSQLNINQKVMIVKKLAPDLKLYYMLFPPEANSHKRILGASVEL